MNIFRKEWKTPATTSALARQMTTNECHLKKGFRKQTGRSIGEYIRELRMNKALELLVSRRYSMLEIAYAIGYANSSEFSAAFKKFYSKAPSHYLTEKNKDLFKKSNKARQMPWLYSFIASQLLDRMQLFKISLHNYQKSPKNRGRYNQSNKSRRLSNALYMTNRFATSFCSRDMVRNRVAFSVSSVVDSAMDAASSLTWAISWATSWATTEHCDTFSVTS